MKRVMTHLFAVLFALSVESGRGAESGSPQPWPHMPHMYMPPAARHACKDRMFQGIPSIAVAPGGRLWATWYGGGMGESQENYVMLATSGDDGVTWTPPVIVIDPPYRASEPAVWIDPSGKLWFMWNLYPIRNSGLDQAIMRHRFSEIGAYEEFIREFDMASTQLWVMTTDTPDDASPEWSSPRLIAMETHNMNKPTVLRNGTWIWPAAPLRVDLMVRPLVSEDGGVTFAYRGGIPIRDEDRNATEYQVVERRDGSLWFLSRTNVGISESVSRDGGRSWSEAAPSAIAHTVSRFFITRLVSGRLLLVKHGAIDRDVGRSELMAFLSDDDGATWSGGLMLDERKGVSYPDGVQAADGRIHIIYDYDRHVAKEILMAVFTEEDVAAGAVVSGKARFKVLVNKASGINPRHEKK